jgi:WXG100 family type VII secretion target
MSKSWDEVKKLLDSPNVPADQKQELLEAWMDDQPEGRISDEQKSYIKDYAPSSDYDDQDENTYEGDNDDDTSSDVDEAYDKANQSAKDAAGKDGSGAKDAGAVHDDEGKLDGKPEPAPEAGTKNSNELLDLGNSALQMYRDFCPILRERPGDCLGDVKDVDFQTQVMDRFHESRDIAFDKMLAESGRFRTAKTTVDEMLHDVDGKLIALYGSWHGEAAQASSQWYSSTVTPAAKDLMTYLGGAADHLDAAVKNIYQAVKNKVDQVQKQYSPEIAQATPDIARKIFALARGDGKGDRNKVGEVAGWVDSKVGSDMNRRLDDDNCDLEEDLQNYVVEQCKKWVTDCFNKDFKSRYVDGFVKTCDDTNKQINDHYDTLNQYLAQYQSKFKNYDGPGAEQSGKESKDSTDTSGSDSSSSDSGGPSHSGGPSQSGGPGGAAQPPPEVAMPGADSASPSGTPGADGQVPGATTDPASVTPGANGQLPGAEDATPGGHPQHVTVTQGDKKLEMSSPDDSGKMSLSVDDGKGHPKNYEIDFGDGEQGDGQQMHATGAEGDAGHGHQGDGPQGDGADGDPEQIKADKDGKAVIHDGDSTITVQRQENGEVTVTVDDGKSEPTEYTLDSDEDGASSVTESGPKPGANADAGIGTGSFSGDLFDDGPAAAAAGPGSGSGGGAGGDPGGGGAGGVGGGGSATPAGVGAGSAPSPGAQFGAMNAQQTGAAPAGAVPAGAAAGGGGSGQGGGMMGAPMMGGMGAGGQGGDSERGPSQWRTVGELFDDDPAAGALRNVRGVLGED